MLYIRQIEGGAGSGNFGHAGRKGLRGGSTASGLGATMAPSKDEFADMLDTDTAGFLDDPNKFLEKDSIQRCGGVATTIEMYSALKKEICEDLSKQTGISEDNVSKILQQWAINSNDTLYASLAIQEAISKEFGIELSPYQQKQLKKAKQARQALLDGTNGSFELLQELSQAPYDREQYSIIKKHHPNWSYADITEFQSKVKSYRYHGQIEILPEADTRKLMRAMYDTTQKAFKAQGIESVVLCRGVDTGYESGMHVEWKGNAAESWTSRVSVATTFQSSGLVAKVPVFRVLCTATTGMGCFEESEYILLGGGGEATTAYFASGDADG